MTVIHEGPLKGAFKGFHNRETIFEFANGSVWQQAEYRYHYHYAYRPQARVMDEGGRYVLYVDGIDSPVAVKRVR